MGITGTTHHGGDRNGKITKGRKETERMKETAKKNPNDPNEEEERQKGETEIKTETKQIGQIL